ncbi:MAG: hypothetical protein QXQ69_01565 [Candidatus Aenigmatarchaeota archaeon]
MEKVVLAFLVVLAVGILAGIVLYFLYPSVNTSDLLTKIFEKAEKVNEIGISYSLSLSYYSGSLERTTSGSLDFIYANGNHKSLIKIESSPYLYFSSSELANYYGKYELEIYSIPEGSIACTKTSIINPTYSCEEFNPVKMIAYPLDIGHQTKNLKELVEKKIASVSYLGEKEFINRKCDYFKFKIDLKKLSQEYQPEFLSSYTNANYTVYSCYDEETGFPLYYSFEMVSNSSYGSYSYVSGLKGEYEAKSLAFDVDETQIRLPVPLEKVTWLPNFEIIESYCDLNSNEVKIAIEALKNMLGGEANLTLKYSTYGTSGDIYITSSYAFNGSYSVFVNPENDNWGGEENYIYQTIDFGNRGKIKWRWMVDEDACCYGFRYLSYWLDGTRRKVLDFREAEKGKWYEYTLELNGTHKIGIGVYSALDGNNDWDAAIDYIEVEKDGSKTIYNFEDGTFQGWEKYNSYGYKTSSVSASSSFEGAKKGEVKILNFTLSSPLKRNESYTIYLEINKVKKTSYCYTSEPRITVTGLFTEILKKIMNITQAT